jgi:hypothetical protein
MFYKAFQVLLITFVVIFTAVGVVLLGYAVTALLFSAFGSQGVGTFAFSVSTRALKLALASIVFLLVAGVYAISRRSRFR